MVTYKWPTWLHKQTQKQRIIWAYKILFLDVLFPLSIKRIIFCDADQIIRADMVRLAAGLWSLVSPNPVMANGSPGTHKTAGVSQHRSAGEGSSFTHRDANCRRCRVFVVTRTAMHTAGRALPHGPARQATGVHAVL